MIEFISPWPSHNGRSQNSSWIKKCCNVQLNKLVYKKKKKPVSPVVMHYYNIQIIFLINWCRRLFYLGANFVFNDEDIAFRPCIDSGTWLFLCFPLFLCFSYLNVCQKCFAVCKWCHIGRGQFDMTVIKNNGLEILIGMPFIVPGF